jgi:predicted Zn-dependent protease
MRTVLIPAALLTLMTLASGCATVPVTGRTQINMIPDSQLNTLSLDAYRKVLGESKVSTDPMAVQTVRDVGQRLAQATESYMSAIGQPIDYEWEFNVIEADTVNAWCMPGGKVAVYTGILPITQSDTGLAVVMGHEIAHALARHGNERMSQALILQLGGATLNAALSSRPEQTRSLFTGLYQTGTQVGVALPHGRMQESEADHIGLIIMAMAGYDPQEAVPFWQRMAEVGGGKRPPEFLSTHPDPSTRVANLQRLMPEALQYYQPNR